jgi:cyclophilin family peptidyl-prolyl cis-trans isomerase
VANKRTRERQLAKLAARRQAARSAQTRRRNRTIAAGAGVLTAAVVFFAGTQLFMHSGKPTASPTMSPTPRPGSKIGTVKPVVQPPKKVACGATAPKDAGAAKPQFTAPKMTIDAKATFTADIVTSCGTITVELLPKVAPLGVNNFVFLAKKHFFDGITFHRIVSGFVVQAGDPKGDGTGGPGYGFDIETSKKVTFDSAGLLAYANSGPGTNGSQFFITLDKQPQLDPSPQGSYTIFGRVTDGMDVVDRIAAVPTTTGTGCASATEKCFPKQAVYVESVSVHVSGIPKPSGTSSPSPS